MARARGTGAFVFCFYLQSAATHQCNVQEIGDKKKMAAMGGVNSYRKPLKMNMKAIISSALLIVPAQKAN